MQKENILKNQKRGNYFGLVFITAIPPMEIDTPNHSHCAKIAQKVS